MFAYEADFADLFEVRGLTRTRRGIGSVHLAGPDRVVFRYVGLDNVERVTEIGFAPAPAALTETYAGFEVTIGAHDQIVICANVRAGHATRAPLQDFRAGLRTAQRMLRKTTSRFVGISTSNEFA